MAAFSLLNVTPVGFAPPAAPRDLHVDTAGRIASSPAAGARTVDCRGAYVSPGWADLHVHIWYGGSDFSIRADDAGMKRGVTAMADAGSAGEANFHGLREYVIERQRETIKAFLNIGSIGLVAANRVPELMDTRFVDIPRTLQVIEANRDVICGIKVCASGVVVGNWGLTPLRMAAHVAEMTGFPLMVHIGARPHPWWRRCSGYCGRAMWSRTASTASPEARFSIRPRAWTWPAAAPIGESASTSVMGPRPTASAPPGAPSRPAYGPSRLHRPARNQLAGPVHDLATTVSKLHAADWTSSNALPLSPTLPAASLASALKEGWNRAPVPT